MCNKKKKNDVYYLKILMEYIDGINVICMSFDGSIVVIVFEDKMGWFWDIKIEECVGLL